MSHKLIPTAAVLLLALGGCAQDELALDGILPMDVIYDAPVRRGPPPAQPIRVAGTQDWGDTTVYPAGVEVSPTPIPWGEAVVVAAPLKGAGLFGAPGTHAPYILDTGDKLRVFVYGQPSLSRLYTVDQVGDIAVPLIGAVRARGRTTTDLEHAIAERLARDYVRDPHVTVDVAQNRPFFILGEVRLPGQYPFVSGMTIETAVAIAGGYTERASERRFRITRRLNGGLVDQIEAPAGYTLLPGDTVYVFERFL